VMDGYRVMPMVQAAREGDIFVTATGDINVIDQKDFVVMKDGAIVCNSGHFNVEVNIPALEAMSTGKKRVREFVEQFTLKDGRHIHLLADGRLVNLSAAEGHPSAVMDMSFANQALGAEWMSQNGPRLEKRVYVIPPEIDKEIARLKLRAMGVEIDQLTAAQLKYLASWEEGT